MAGFDAGTAVEPMDWNFTAFGGGKGVVPEPSTKDMKDFQKEFGSLMREGAKLEDVDDEQVKNLSEEELAEIQASAEGISDQMDALVARLCKDSPSLEEMAVLPFRVKIRFSRWLMEQFNPESVAAGTKP